MGTSDNPLNKISHLQSKEMLRVRALEVAEAAKRREEKKQTEREKRKAAVELERERLKQEKEHRQKGGPGAAVEPTVCNRKVPGSSPSLCTFVWVRLEA